MIKRLFTTLIFVVFFFNNFLTVAATNFTKAVINIEELTINEVMEAMDKGYLSSELLVSLYLERIEAYNGLYKAITVINDEALSLAKQLDEERKTNGKRSILHGIPVVIKDNFDFVPYPTTGGTKALLDSYPVNNAFIVQRLVDAGAIILAKTNMSAFAFSGTSSKSSFMTTLNAYHTSYSSHGSSGGTAVAIAANLAMIGLGTDTNSSIRTPAAVNGLVGLRPTLGLISRSGIMPYTLERDTGGPMTRTVTDLAIMLDFLVGFDSKDSVTTKSIDKIPETYTTYLNSNGLKGKRIGVIKDFISGNKNATIPVLRHSSIEMETLMNNAIADMEKLGAEIIYIENFYTKELHNLYNSSLDGYMLCSDLNTYFSHLNKDNRIKTFADLMNDGRYIYNINNYASYCNNNIRDNNKYTNLLNNKIKYENYVTKFMTDYEIDAFAYPTFKTKPITITGLNKEPNTSTSHSISPTIGWPSITVPMGFDTDGLPYGLQFASEPFSEGKLIEIAFSYEQETNHRRPPSIAPSLYDTPKEIEALINTIDYVESNLRLQEWTKESLDDLMNQIEYAKNGLYNYHLNEVNINYLLEIINVKIDKLEIESSDNDENKNHQTMIIKVLGSILLVILIYQLTKKKKNK